MNAKEKLLEEHRRYHRDYMRNRYRKDKAFREKWKARVRRYAQTERGKVKRREQYRKHREHYLEYYAMWRKKHPDYQKQYYKKRAATIKPR